jgi:hypothetical protein
VDYCCVRPVSMGRNKKVVTYIDNLDKEWELRESIVRVNENDAVLQAKRKEIECYYIQGEGHMELRDASLVMGRHELTRKNDLDTTLEVDVKFLNGFLCLKSNDLLPYAIIQRGPLPMNEDEPPVVDQNGELGSSGLGNTLPARHGSSLPKPLGGRNWNKIISRLLKWVTPV